MDLSQLFKRIDVTTGRDCQISPFSSLENVVLGDRVMIGDGVQLKNVVVGSGTKLGRNVTLYSSVPDRPVRIGRTCWLSFGVFGEATGGEIALDDYVVIAHATTILTSSGPGNQSPIMSALYPTELGPVLVGAHSWVGAQCVLLPGAALGEGVVVGSNALVPRGSYEAWSLYGGTPARLIKKLPASALAPAKADFRSKGSAAEAGELHADPSRRGN